MLIFFRSFSNEKNAKIRYSERSPKDSPLLPVDRGMRLFGMRNRKAWWKRRSSGQELIETALLMPFMLALIFNAVNFGWFFYVALNISSGSRSGDLYAMLGSQTPVDPSGIHTGEYAPPGAGGTLTGCIGTADCTVQAVM